VTDEIEELALEAALRRRRPSTLPDGFAARLDRVPDEVRPFRSLAVRSGLAVLPWAAVATVALIVAVAPRFLTAGLSSVGTAPASGWDPAAPGGGFADVGPLGVPWVPILLLIALYAAITAVRRVLSGGPLLPDLRSWPRPWGWRRDVIWEIAFIVVVALVIYALDPFREPLSSGSMAAAPDAVESREITGDRFDESGTEYVYQDSEYIYRLRPGDAYSTIVTVRNTGTAAPITLLGLPRSLDDTTASGVPGSVSVPTGLGLLRDPTGSSLAPGDVLPFHPVTLLPGEEVGVVIGNLAGPCADPTAIVPDQGSDPGPAVGIPFVYEAFGWRRVEEVYPPFQVTVAGTPGCAPN